MSGNDHDKFQCIEVRNNALEFNCEQIDNSKLQEVAIRILAESNLPKDKKFNLKRYPRCVHGNTLDNHGFSPQIGADMVTWLVENGIAKSRSMGVSIGHLMVETGYLSPVSKFRTEKDFKDENLYFSFKGKVLFSLSVTIVEAHNLSQKENLFGIDKNTPYATVKVGKNKYSTKPISENLSPVWNETFLFTSVQMKDKVRVKIKDKVLLKEFGHRYGEVEIPVREIPDRLITKTYQLSPPPIQIVRVHITGEVVLKIQRKVQAYVGPASISNEKFLIPSDSRRESPTNELIESGSSTDTDDLNVDDTILSKCPIQPVGRETNTQSTHSKDKHFKIDKEKCRDDDTLKSNELFRKKFNLPASETVLESFHVNLLRCFLIPGRLYISQNYLCIIANVFDIQDVVTIARVEINAIEIESKVVMNPGVTLKTKDNNEVHLVYTHNWSEFYQKLLAWKKRCAWKHLSVPIKYMEDPSLVDSHSKVELFSQVFPMTLGEFFLLYYSDNSTLLPDLHNMLRHKRLFVESWQCSHHGSFRTLTYCEVPSWIANYLKSCRVSELQRYEWQGNTLVVDEAFLLHDFPSEDFFTIELHHTASEVGTTTKLVTHCKIVWTNTRCIQEDVMAKTEKMIRKYLSERCALQIKLGMEEVAKNRVKSATRTSQSWPWLLVLQLMLVLVALYFALRAFLLVRVQGLTQTSTVPWPYIADYLGFQ